jgi:hypothetical protein
MFTIEDPGISRWSLKSPSSKYMGSIINQRKYCGDPHSAPLSFDSYDILFSFATLLMFYLFFANLK